jgi:LAO/AO transport system kinase
MERAILAMLSLAHRPDGWQPIVVKTVATEGQGIDELIEAVAQCQAFLQNSPARLEKKKDAARQRLITLLQERLLKTTVEKALPDGKLDSIVEQIANRQQDPYSVVDEIIRSLRFK